MFEKILDLIYPNVCGICNRINNENLCERCKKELSKYELYQIDNYTSDETKYFDYLYCTLIYEGIVRKKIISYKFGGEAYLYKTFTKIIINNKKIYDFLKLYDIILSVPMCKNKESVRGYNQSTLIAKELAKKVNIKFENDILIKIKETKIQSTLDKKQRQENVNNAFDIKNKEIIDDKKIVLFDDIYTTGSTANECSRILKNAGAKEILVVTLAKDLL